MGSTVKNLGKAQRQRKLAGVPAKTGEATTGREQRKLTKSFRERLGESGTVSQASRKDRVPNGKRRQGYGAGGRKNEEQKQKRP